MEKSYFPWGYVESIASAIQYSSVSDPHLLYPDLDPAF
jgi:hypothetical protein